MADKIDNTGTTTQAEFTDNSGKTLKEIAKIIRDRNKSAQKASLESLKAYRLIGEKLTEAKSILPKGSFGHWVQDEFGYTKQWSAPLMKLHQESARIDEALAWAGERMDTPGTRGKFTVLGVLLLLREMDKSREEFASGESAQPPRRKKETFKTRMEREIAAARRRITLLESKLAANNLEIPAEEENEFQDGPSDVGDCKLDKPTPEPAATATVPEPVNEKSEVNEAPLAELVSDTSLTNKPQQVAKPAEVGLAKKAA